MRHRDKKGTIDMKTKKKHQHARGEVTELARETAKVEQYWIVGDRSEPHKPPKNYNYVEELIHLQIELIKLQEYMRHNHLKMCVVFEGRDAAGKGGVIKRITDPLNPRVCRVVALSTPTERERKQWYFLESPPFATSMTNEQLRFRPRSSETDRDQPPDLAGLAYCPTTQPRLLLVFAARPTHVCAVDSAVRPASSWLV